MAFLDNSNGNVLKNKAIVESNGSPKKRDLAPSRKVVELPISPCK